MALVVLSVVEQRLDAVRAVLDGGDVVEVAASVGVHRSTLHRWIARYLLEGLPGLSDRSHRPESCPHQVTSLVEVRVAEMRREHPRWGAKRIRMELLRKPGAWSGEGLVVPSERTIVRILARQGLSRSRPRKRPRSSYRRWERPGPMQLWGIDIVGGIWIADLVTGELREAKVVTGVDDHSRFCVMAKVVQRATGRAVCLAFAQALRVHGVPEEVLTDNGKQFTDRFGKHATRNGEVLFDKICRKNGIRHRLTAPASPNQNGKVERFHGTFRPDFLDVAEPFTSVAAAQAAVDAWVTDYNTERPHQALDKKIPVTPAQKFSPVPDEQRALVDLWLPPALETAAQPASGEARPEQAPDIGPAVSGRSGGSGWSGGAIEFDRVVPPTGMITIARKSFWIGGYRAGLPVRVWADVDVIHLLVAGARVKSVRSHLSVNDLAKLVERGAVPAGPPPLPAPEDGDAIEVDRVVSAGGTVSLGQHVVLAAEILGGRQVGIRIEPEPSSVLMFFDLQTRELLRTRANPLTEQEIRRIRGARGAGPPPRPSTEPIRVQRRASNTGVIMVAGQKVALGRIHRHQTVTVVVSETTLAVDLEDGETKVVRRTTTQPVRSIKGHRPRTA